MSLMCLLLSLGGMDEKQFEIRRADVGDNVTLTCDRNPSENRQTYVWTRFVPGSPPDVLGATFSFDNNHSNKYSHFVSEQGPGTFLLKVLKVTPLDTGFYYCSKTGLRSMTFLKGAFLRVQGKTDLKQQ